MGHRPDEFAMSHHGTSLSIRVLRRRARLESKRQPSCLGPPVDFPSLNVCSASNKQHDTATPSLTEAYARRSRLVAEELVTFLGVHEKTSHDVMVRCADGLLLTRCSRNRGGLWGGDGIAQSGAHTNP